MGRQSRRKRDARAELDAGPAATRRHRWPSIVVLILLVATVGVVLARATRDAPPPKAVEIPLPASWERLPEGVRSLVRDAADQCRANPKNPATFGRLARIYHGNGEDGLALACYDIALDLGADDARTHYLVGLVRQERGEALRAAEAFEAAIEHTPEYAPSHWNLGRCRLDAADLDGAIVAFDRAIALDDTDPSFHATLGSALAPGRTPRRGRAFASRGARARPGA